MTSKEHAGVSVPTRNDHDLSSCLPRILIIDDDLSTCRGLQELLRGHGYVVESAQSAAAGFAMLSKHPPDVVLTDLQMPEMDGITLCRGLRAFSPELPVIVITGSMDTGSAVRALQAGAEDYLTKPVDVDELVISIQRAIERRAARVERQQLRVRTTELHRQALAALDANEEVLSVVAHDLRNPLGVIALGAQQLLQAASSGALDPSVRAGASSILRNAERMERLIADLLDESRLRTGGLALERDYHPISQLLTDVSELRPLAQQKSVSLLVRPPEPDRLLFCDRGRMGQALGNLLTNAIKFSAAGSTVTVFVELEERGVRFAVRDEGPGISPDASKRIFDPFWQTEKASRAGIGLGLYIVKGIAESHGGSVSVDSQLGIGSTFYVSVPEVSASASPAVSRT
jgi:signal transduction histidine kinase